MHFHGYMSDGYSTVEMKTPANNEVPDERGSSTPMATSSNQLNIVAKAWYATHERNFQSHYCES